MRGYAAIGLYQPKTNHNVGSVLRAATCYDVSMVAIEGRRYKKASTDTTTMHRHKPLIQTDDILSVIPYDCVPIAVEFIPTARSLINYIHPTSAFYIFGPEDGNIPNNIIEKCRDVIYIPTTYCMNLAATVNVVLYDRLQGQIKN